MAFCTVPDSQVPLLSHCKKTLALDRPCKLLFTSVQCWAWRMPWDQFSTTQTIRDKTQNQSKPPVDLIRRTNANMELMHAQIRFTLVNCRMAVCKTDWHLQNMHNTFQRPIKPSCFVSLLQYLLWLIINIFNIRPDSKKINYNSADKHIASVTLWWVIQLSWKRNVKYALPD